MTSPSRYVSGGVKTMRFIFKNTFPTRQKCHQKPQLQWKYNDTCTFIFSKQTTDKRVKEENRKFLLETVLVISCIRWMRSRRLFRVWLGTIMPYLHISWHVACPYLPFIPQQWVRQKFPNPVIFLLNSLLLADWATVIGWKQDVITSIFC